MSSITMARYRMRALIAASSIGLLIGASAGAAFLGGRLAKDASTRSQAARLMQMAELNNGDMTTSAALGTKPLNTTAIGIAQRFAPYGGSNDQSAMVAQTLTALRTSTDMRQQKGIIVRASLPLTNGGMSTAMLNTTPLSAMNPGSVISDHPVRPAAAMVFKAHSQNDSDCLTQAVYYEARGEGLDGMRAVAQVILNRVRHPAFPKTICGVVYQGAYQRTGCQFSFVCNGAMANPVEAWAWRRARDVASAALEGYVMKPVGTATHFHTLSVDPIWAGNMVEVTTIGSHIFYQFRGRGSRIGNGTDGVSPSGDMPVVVQTTSTAPATPDATTAMPAPATTAPATAQPAPQTVGDPKTAQLITTLSRLDSAPRPVTLSAKLTGQPAQAIAATLSQASAAPASAPTTTQAAPAKTAP